MDDHVNGSIVFDDVAPIEVPVTIGGKQYVLREADENAAVKFQNAASRGARRLADGSIIMPDSANDAEPILVSCCLHEVYEVNGDRRVRPVILSQVMSWPARIVRAIADKAKEISRLNVTEAKTEAKNSHAAMPVTST